MDLPYLSEAWFQAAQQKLVNSAGDDLGLDQRLQFDAETSDGHVRWAVVLRNGLVEFRLGELSEADIELHHSLEHAWQVFGNELSGDDALAGYTVVEERPPGQYRGRPAPMELIERPELANLPAFPGVSLDVQYLYHRGPFGPVSWYLTFVDGQVQEMDLGTCNEPDVVIEATFLQMAQVRHGDITILDALASGAKVKGSEGALALVAGIVESPEFHAAELACGRSAFALAALGEIQADPGYGASLEELQAMTGPPVGL